MTKQKSVAMPNFASGFLILVLIIFLPIVIAHKKHHQLTVEACHCEYEMLQCKLQYSALNIWRPKTRATFRQVLKTFLEFSRKYCLLSENIKGTNTHNCCILTISDLTLTKHLCSKHLCSYHESPKLTKLYCDIKICNQKKCKTWKSKQQ